MTAWHARDVSHFARRRRACAGPGLRGLRSAAEEPAGSSAPPEGQAGHVQGFLGGVVADEPNAALAGRAGAVARRRRGRCGGGDRAEPGGDAAVARGAGRRRRLPRLCGGPQIDQWRRCRKRCCSCRWRRAAAGQQCRPAGGAADAGARACTCCTRATANCRSRAWSSPAEEAARFGVPVSRALARDLAPVAGPLFADPEARAVFSQDGAAADGWADAGAAGAGGHAGAAARVRRGRPVPGRCWRDASRRTRRWPAVR